ncbi:hypothetical protein NC656_09340 [Pseudomonas asiatica]|uniref:hypothetical protein n=1 Tax=Pseudomonas asiatica TaxID=2219225 RepID=UPI00209C6620|nr:hypothetical protein [Pseudomonas asiatica]MCO8261751.1 hypothetical protein [Pseudomonas asiatica]
MTARTGQPKTGGRKKGTLDKGERQIISDGLAGDLLAVYKKLGGVKWLLEFAKNNPAEFIRQGLSRLLPAPQKEGDDTGGNHNTQNNYYNMTPLEAAQRVAFALSVGARELEKQTPVTIEHAPEVAVEPAWLPPAQPEPEPELDDFQRDMGRCASREREREQWAREVHLTPEERADKALVRETTESDISHYRGSSAEQPGGSVPRPPPRELSAGERRRAVMSRRGRDLL